MYSKEEHDVAQILKQINKLFTCFHCEKRINVMYVNLIYLLDIDDDINNNIFKICNDCLCSLKKYDVNNDKCSLHNFKYQDDKSICQYCKNCISCNPF